MTKIFKHLAKHWAACLVIIALLLVQAYGDLTLPDYTSKIVDTGIQQSGIADAVPEVVRDSTLQVLELLMTDALPTYRKSSHPPIRSVCCGPMRTGIHWRRYFPPRILCSIWLPLRQPGRATPRMPPRWIPLPPSLRP